MTESPERLCIIVFCLVFVTYLSPDINITRVAKALQGFTHHKKISHNLTYATNLIMPTSYVDLWILHVKYP